MSCGFLEFVLVRVALMMCRAVGVMFRTEASRLFVAQIFVATKVMVGIAFETLVQQFAKTETTSSNGNTCLGIEFLIKNTSVETSRNERRQNSYSVTVQTAATQSSRCANFRSIETFGSAGVSSFALIASFDFFLLNVLG